MISASDLASIAAFRSARAASASAIAASASARAALAATSASSTAASAAASSARRAATCSSAVGGSTMPRRPVTCSRLPPTWVNSPEYPAEPTATSATTSLSGARKISRVRLRSTESGIILP